jgi:hypothetical protein
MNLIKLKIAVANNLDFSDSEITELQKMIDALESEEE